MKSAKKNIKIKRKMCCNEQLALDEIKYIINHSIFFKEYEIDLHEFIRPLSASEISAEANQNLLYKCLETYYLPIWYIELSEWKTGNKGYWHFVKSNSKSEIAFSNGLFNSGSKKFVSWVCKNVDLNTFEKND